MDLYFRLWKFFTHSPRCIFFPPAVTGCMWGTKFFPDARFIAFLRSPRTFGRVIHHAYARAGLRQYVSQGREGGRADRWPPGTGKGQFRDRKVLKKRWLPGSARGEGEHSKHTELPLTHPKVCKGNLTREQVCTGRKETVYKEKRLFGALDADPPRWFTGSDGKCQYPIMSYQGTVHAYKCWFWKLLFRLDHFRLTINPFIRIWV